MPSPGRKKNEGHVRDQKGANIQNRSTFISSRRRFPSMALPAAPDTVSVSARPKSHSPVDFGAVDLGLHACALWTRCWN